MPPNDVREHVEKIVASRTFARSTRLIRFLRHAVEKTLAGDTDSLREQILGPDVFDRRGDYDPRIDPIVRVEAGRLRTKLKSYYASGGKNDTVGISLPRGSYVPKFQFRASAAKKPTARKGISIAIPPFLCLSPDIPGTYFADGLTEELIHLFTRVPELRIVAWHSAAQLRERDLAAIRNELKVSHVLQGSVRRAGDNIRIAMQLVEAESGDYIWSDAYDFEYSDMLAMQEKIAKAVVSALRLRLGVKRPAASTNPECHRLCLLGRFHANKRTSDGFRQSVAYFEQAIAADGSYAAAYSGLADAYSLLSDYGVVGPSEGVPLARAAAEKALTLDPDSAEANASLGFIRALHEWEWEAGEKLFRRAIDSNPGYAQAHHWYGIDLLARLGRFDEAQSEMEAAAGLDPLSAIINEGLGYLHMLRGDYAKAVAVYRDILRFDPNFYKAYSSMARAYVQWGKLTEAIAAFDEAERLGGPVPNIIAGRGQALALAGRTAEARGALKRLESMERTRWIPGACFGTVKLGMKDYDGALTHFEQACDRRELAVTAFKVHPLYDSVREHPRFQALLRRINLLP